MGIIVIVAFAALFVYFLAPAQVLQWISYRINQTITNIAAGDYIHRADEYKWGIALAQKMPFYGFGGKMTYVFHDYVITQPNQYPSLVNTFDVFMSLLTSGFFGLVLIMAIFIVGVLSAYRIWMVERNRNSKFYLFAMALLIISILIPVDQAKIEFSRVAVIIQFYFILYAIVSSWYHLAQMPDDSLAV